MVWSKSIVLANVCLLIGVSAFLAVPSGCSGGGDEAQVGTDTQAVKPAPEAAAAEEASEPKEEVTEPAAEAPEKGEAKEPAAAPAKPPQKTAPPAAPPKPVVTPPGKAVLAGKTAPCAACHADQKKTPHVLKGASCITCHLDTAAHLKDKKTKPTTPSTREACLKCHSEAAAKKAGALLVKADHNPEDACISCHAVHE